MSDPVGTFRIDIEIENPIRPGERVGVQGLLVDTGSELTWIPAGILERWTGSAWIYAAGTWTSDEVVAASETSDCRWG